MSSGRPHEEHLGVPRLNWESDHEWRCRTVFLDTNKSFYSGDRLAAYSMAWANWKFMGNRYGEDVQTILQKCHDRLPDHVDKEIQGLHEAVHPKIAFVKSTEKLGGRKVLFPDSNVGSSCSSKLQNADSPSSSKKSYSNYFTKPKSPSPPPVETKPELIPGLTIFVPSRTCFNPINSIYGSCQRCNIHLEFIEESFKPPFKCTVFMKSLEIATGYGVTRKEAKHDCAEKALALLMEKQKVIYRSEINHDHVRVVEKGTLVKESYENAAKLDDSNKGNKLLRKMGWKGSGGVGKHEHGRADPVFVQAADGRQGVGTSPAHASIKRRTVEERLLDFMRTEDLELRFSNELTNQERAIIHKMSQKLGLGHKSHGKGDERYLVVSKKGELHRF